MLSWGLTALGGSSEIKKGCRVDGKEGQVSSGLGQLSLEFSCAGVPIPADYVAKVKESVPAVIAIALYMPTLGHFMPTPSPREKVQAVWCQNKVEKAEPEVAEFGKLAVPECFVFVFVWLCPVLVVARGIFDLQCSTAAVPGLLTQLFLISRSTVYSVGVGWGEGRTKNLIVLSRLILQQISSLAHFTEEKLRLGNNDLSKTTELVDLRGGQLFI